MRLIIDCEPDRLDVALTVLHEQIATITKYDRLGWGWSFNVDGCSFFVRAIRNGLSITQRGRRP